jgi:hypothetical protein
MNNLEILALLKRHKWFDKRGRVNSNKSNSLNQTDIEDKNIIKQHTVFLRDGASWTERIFCITHNITHQHTCSNSNCSNPVEFLGKEDKPYREYCCLRCMQTDSIIIEKKKKTTKEHYGVEHPAQSPMILEKMQSTNLLKYGNKNASCSEEIKIKQKETMKTRYGVENPSQITTSQEKKKQTNLSRYGVEHIIQKPDIIESNKTKNVERYGVENPFKSSQFQKEIKGLVFKKYGVHHVSELPGYLEKRIQTNLSRYGVESTNHRHIDSNTLQILKNREWLTEQHHTLKLPLCLIAKNLSVSPHTVETRFKLYDIPIKYYYTSSHHIEIVEFIKSLYSGLIVENDRTAINPHEIDILLPELNIGIEVNGIFWHSELNGKSKCYHLTKTKESLNRGIRLIHVYDIEWINKKDIVKSRIQTLLDKNKKLFARKCEIRNVDSTQATTFVNQYHIQGHVNSSVKVGLFYNDELVSLMTFGKPRFNKHVDWELLRFCSKAGYTVVGGASRLFYYFIRTYNPKTLLSYCDMRYGIGNVYDRLGFKQENWSAPNYKYFKKNASTQLFSRNTFQKHKLPELLTTFDANLTEWNNMVNNGYDRIWDCGNTVWIYYNE